MKNLKHLVLNITENCNLRCDYCFLKNKKNNKMTFGEAKKAIDFLLKENARNKDDLSITFFGGEPLLVFSEVKKIVNYIKINERIFSKSIHIHIVTNGTLLTKIIIDFFKQNNIDVILSCDGVAESQDLHRKFVNGSATFIYIEKYLNDLSKIQSSKVRLTISPDTVDHIYKNLMFFTRFGFSQIGLICVDDANWSPENLKKLEQELIRSTDFWLANINKRKYFCLRPIADFLLKFYNKKFKFQLHMHKCWAGNIGFCLIPGGDIYPCHRFASYRKAKLGNIKLQIYPTKFKEFQNIQSMDVEGCLAVNLTTTGTMLKMSKNSKDLKRIYFKITDDFYKKLRDTKIKVNYSEIKKMLTGTSEQVYNIFKS